MQAQADEKLPPGRQAGKPAPGLYDRARQQQLRISIDQEACLPLRQAEYLRWRRLRRIADGTRVFCIAGTGNHSFGIRRGLLVRWMAWRQASHTS